jgi:TolA-binding protein
MMSSFHSLRPAVPLAILLAMLALAPQVPAQSPESPTQRAYRDARTLYDRGKIAEALAALQAFESQHRFSAMVPQAVYLQGWCWAGLQKYREAVNAFDRLRKGYPSASMVPDAILKEAECYRELKNYPAMLDLYRAFELQYPNHKMFSRALLGEAWTLFKQGDFTSAQAIADKVLTRYANNSSTVLDAQLLIAQVLVARKQYDDALRIYQQIPRNTSDARASEALFVAGESLFYAGRWTDAIDCYKQVQPKAGLIENLHRQINELRSQQPDYAQRGDLPTYEGQMSDLGQLETRCETAPDWGASALSRIADCYRSLGRPDEAIAVYREFLALHPDDRLAEQVHLAIIQELVDQHRFDEAEAAASQFQARYDKSASTNDVQLLEAEALFAAGKTADAIDRFQRLAASNARSPILEAADLGVADGYFALHDFEHARDSFQAFVQQHPTSGRMPDGLFRLGRCWFELSRKTSDPPTARTDLAEAIKAYEQLGAAFPSNSLIPEVTFQLGYLNACLATQDDNSTDKKSHFEKAAAAFQEFINRWPGNPLAAEALYQLARNQHALGRCDEAVKSYDKLDAEFPNSAFTPLAVYEIGNCYGVENKRVEMVKQFRKFAARYPAHERIGSALYSIASQLERDGKTDEALTIYRDIVTRAMSATEVPIDFRNAAIASELRIASILAARGDVADAIADCQRVLGKFHDDPAAVHALIGQIAETYRLAKQFTDARTWLEHLATEYPHIDSVRIATLTSTIDLALDQYDNARAYEAALKLLGDPEKDRLPAASYVSIGNALLTHNRFADARDAYEKSLAMYPNDSATASLAQLGSGEAALGLNLLAEAEGIFQEVIRKYPENPAHERAQLGLARVYLARANNSDRQDPNNAKAIALLNAIMGSRTTENAGEAAYLLGKSWFSFSGDERENKRNALVCYVRASLVMSGPHADEAAFRSGQCNQALGNTQLARRAFEAYLRRFPHGQFAADAKKELESLMAQRQPS